MGVSSWSDTATSTCWTWSNTSTTSSITSDDIYGTCKAWSKYIIEYRDRIPAKLPPGKRTMELPDGAKLVVDDLGNYHIEDADAKVTYKANRIREFSPHLNASDMLAKFIEYVGTLGVRRDELMGLPINLFIQWLIIEAAQRDDDPLPPDVMPLPQNPKLLAVVKPKCLCCGRFIPRLHAANRFPFCTPQHGAIYVERRTPKIAEPVEQQIVGAA